jgi:hypothetical protein
MQSQLMPALMDLLDQLWMSLGMLANQMECSAHTMPIQHIQNAQCITRVRTIVKGQRDLAAGRVAIK